MPLDVPGAIVVDKKLGPTITCKVDGSSWADSLRNHCPELSGGDPAIQQVSNAFSMDTPWQLF